MKDTFEYKDYLGSAEIDIEGEALVGKLLFIRDVVAYSASSVRKLEAAFREAVDDYLSTCEQLGEEPDKPCKGTFNVRIGPTLHREVALVARSKGLGLNEFVCRALTSAIDERSPRTIEHHYEVRGVGAIQTAQRIATATRPATWESVSGIKH